MKKVEDCSVLEVRLVNLKQRLNDTSPVVHERSDKKKFVPTKNKQSGHKNDQFKKNRALSDDDD